MWKNIVERGRPRMTIWRMRIACCVAKVTHTRARTHASTRTHTRTHTHTHTHRLSICNIYSFSTATIVARTRLNVRLYVQCLSSSAITSNFTSSRLSSFHTQCRIDLNTNFIRQTPMIPWLLASD
jgi:hypothetical protein